MPADTLDALSARVDNLEKQVSEIFERLNNTRETQSGIAEKLNGVLVTLGEVKQVVTNLQSAPGRKWDSLIMAVIAAIIAAIVGYIFK